MQPSAVAERVFSLINNNFNINHQKTSNVASEFQNSICRGICGLPRLLATSCMVTASIRVEVISIRVESEQHHLCRTYVELEWNKGSEPQVWYRIKVHGSRIMTDQ
jgi:hypothetical protein